MKGFSLEITGSKGPWYKKVNDVVSRAMETAEPAFIIELLGEPDFIEEVETNDRMCDGNNETDLKYPSVYWNYSDPYRPSKIYRFGISGNTVIERSYVTNAI